MQFNIIEQLGHPARGRVGLWLNFATPGTSTYMLQGGEIIEVEQTYHCNLDPNMITLLTHECEQKQGELKFLEFIDRGGSGYNNQQDLYYGITTARRHVPGCRNTKPPFEIGQGPMVNEGDLPQMDLRLTRMERILSLKQYIGELQVDIHRCAEMLWLMEAGAIFDKERNTEKKTQWLEAVRNESRPTTGTQLVMF